MTHVLVTHYVESWQGKNTVALHPGVFPYMFVKDMFGKEFMQERLADGTLVVLDQEENIEA